MVRVRYTAEGGHYRIAGHGFDPGDERDVGGDLADYLADRDDFEMLDESVDGDGDGGDGDADDTADGDGDTFDVTAFLNRTPVDVVADDIAAGEADDHLDTVAENADRMTVQDAVGERRAELAEED